MHRRAPFCIILASDLNEALGETFGVAGGWELRCVWLRRTMMHSCVRPPDTGIL